MSNQEPQPQYQPYPPHQYPGMPPLKQAKFNPPGTDTFSNEAGRWMLWSVLLFALPATLAVYPGVQGILALLTLVPPVVTSIIGASKALKLQAPGMRSVYSWGFLLSLPIVGGVLWQYITVSNTGDAGTTTYPAWFSMFAMLAISIVALSQAANLNPAIVHRRERFLSNATLAILLGTTIAGFSLPLLLIMSMSLFFAGWLAYWFFMAVPVILIIAFSIKLIYQAGKERKLNNGARLPKGALIRFPKLFSWSIIVASAAFILGGTILINAIIN